MRQHSMGAQRRDQTATSALVLARRGLLERRVSSISFAPQPRDWPYCALRLSVQSGQSITNLSTRLLVSQSFSINCAQISLSAQRNLLTSLS